MGNPMVGFPIQKCLMNNIILCHHGNHYHSDKVFLSPIIRIVNHRTLAETKGRPRENKAMSSPWRHTEHRLSRRSVEERVSVVSGEPMSEYFNILPAILGGAESVSTMRFHGVPK